MKETGPTEQRVVGDSENEHRHGALVHTHDHWHVSHHKSAMGGFDHKTRYHSHGHDHNELVHAHRDHDPERETKDHGDTAHDHDHSDPTGRG